MVLMEMMRTFDSEGDAEVEVDFVEEGDVDVQAMARTESATASSSAEGSKKMFAPTAIAIMMTGGFSTAFEVLDWE